MAKGTSGRVVIEIDPTLKRELYATLAISGSTLKDWFVRSAEEYCVSGTQRSLFGEISGQQNSDKASSNELQVEQGEPNT